MRNNPATWNVSAWFTLFRKRWAQHIRLRKAKDSTAARSSPELWQRIPEFMAAYKKTLDSGNYLPEYVINIDETKASPNRRSGDEMVLASPGKQESHRYIRVSAQPRTVVVCAAASGRVWMTVKIFARSDAEETTRKKRLLVPRHSPNTRKSWPRFYCYTDKGSMTQELWGELITQLMKLLNETRRDLPVLLLCDHPTVHDNVPLWDLLHKQNATMMFFPHNSSHILQPLDGAPFAEFKRVARELQQDIAASQILSNDQEFELRSYVEEAEGEAFRIKTIIAGFVQRGIFPFSPETIEANMRNILPPLKEETPSGQNSLLIETLSGFREVIKASHRSRVQAVDALPAKVQLYDSHELLLKAKRKELEQKAKEDEKAKKITEREANRMRREQEKREKLLNPPKRGRPRQNRDLPDQPPQKKARVE